MVSLRAKLVNVVARTTFKSKPIHLMDADVLRRNAESRTPRTPKDISLEIVTAPAKGEWHRSLELSCPITVLYLHGGGYVFGSPKSHRMITFALARKLRARVFSLDYRMSPEAVFPAAVEDAVAAYRWLHDSGVDPKELVVVGDSAGGGLALAMLNALNDNDLPQPAAAIVYSPWTDLAATGDSVIANTKSDVMFRGEYIREGAKRYLGDADPKAPLASPLYADHEGLPPILIFASSDEVLYNDSTRVHDKLLERGVSSTLIVEAGLPHVWPIFAGLFPEASKAIDQSVEFINHHTKQE